MARLFLAVASGFALAGLSLGDEPKKLSDEEITKLMGGTWENTGKFGTITIRTVEEEFLSAMYSSTFSGRSLNHAIADEVQ